MKARSATTRTVDAYLRALPADQRDALERLRKIIRTAAPKAVEGFSYGLPAFILDDTAIAGMAATKTHCAFYPMSGSIVAAFADELTDFKTSKGTIHFQPDRPLPAAIVKQLVKARIQEVTSKVRSRK